MSVTTRVRIAMFCLVAVLPLGNSLAGEAVQATVVSDSGDRIVLHYAFDEYRSEAVEIQGKTYRKISFPSEPLWMEKGSPALPHVNRSIIIPDDARMTVEVLSADYYETKAAIAPSKGKLYRTVDPSEVPYVFGEVYKTDAFFPGPLATLGGPYILRDHRGITVRINPFQYNPVTGLLRVYTEITVAVEASGPGAQNVFTRQAGAARPSVAFQDIYRSHFLNFAATSSRYAPINELGDMLIISHDAWIPNMGPLVTHKNSIGISTTIVGVSTIGNDYASIKSYIQGVYDTGNLAFVLLVGDYAEIDSPIVSGGASDATYSKLAGDDDYPEIIVGRFSAATAADVDTQVERTVEYETLPANEQDWFWKGIGLASTQGAGEGDEGQADNVHMAEIRDWLLAAGYTHVDELYGSVTAAQVAAALNEGRGILNYCGHGSPTSFSTSGFSNSDVNALVNDNMLPFVNSVACNTGEFENYGTCFAEAWLRATHNGEPTGAIAMYASSISQSWAPPMECEDEMNLLLTDPLQPYFSYGALCYAGSSSMMDDYAAGGVEMFNTWVLFGDPSVRILGRACSDAGRLNLDRGVYSCEDTVNISVVDCNMHDDDQVAETTIVGVDSTTEPGVETATLVEKDLASPIAEGSIGISETDTAGSLMVAEGDTITVTYIDADDGEGGIDVPVTAEAAVDCTAPMISNAQVINVTHNSASVTFDANEPARGVVDYGLSCGAVTSSSENSAFATSVAVAVAGLQENTTYYLVVHAIDEAGNGSTDDNGGQCYSFTTTDVPNYFTEQFGTDNDLAYHRLSFQPNGSIDFYAGCQDPIVSFPTDPAGGTEVTLSDDGSTLVTLSGATVSLYGVSYGEFYLNANGNITFVSSDGDYTETLGEHFDTPRISALFDDLTPAAGTVSWKQLADRVAVTWEGVSEYNAGNSNSFQIEMFFNGTISISLLEIAATDGIAGLSGGGGLSPEFVETDLSTMVSCGGFPCLDGVLGEDEDLIDCGGPCPACQCLSDGECGDGLFCTGSESCNEYGHCVAGSDPCPGAICKETNETCVDCLNDSHCDDGLFCNGVEHCRCDNTCAAGPLPCPWTTCDDAGDVCIICDYDGICEPGEDCANCRFDCIKGSAAVCGNGVCETGDGETCITCPDDCNGKQNGLLANQYCCGNGIDGNNPVTCADARCTEGGNTCTTVENLAYCCGDSTCEDIETRANCPADCTPMVPGEAGGGAWLMVEGFDRATGMMSISYGVPCAAMDHTIRYAELTRANLESYVWGGQECHIGASGLHDWPTAGTPDALFFVVVADNGEEEGSYGRSSYGMERTEDAASATCQYVQNLQYSCE